MTWKLMTILPTVIDEEEFEPLKHYLQEIQINVNFISLLVGLLIYLTNIWFIAHNGLEYGKK